jgi:hypothetical protein
MLDKDGIAIVTSMIPYNAEEGKAYAKNIVRKET